MNRSILVAAVAALLAMASGCIAFLGLRQIVRARARSRMDMLAATWEDYKRNHWDRVSGRTVDEGLTTSEGQSYTLLRSAWQGDRATFDKTWQWTRENLQHRSDHLFSWLFGRRRDGGEGILTERHGESAASDADTDIAFALLLAYGRWGDGTYLEQAKDVIDDLWKYEVVHVRGLPYLAADDRSQKGPFLDLNPSYLSPYAYRYFARVNSEHDWLAVVDTSYDLLARCLSSPLGGPRSAGLPPDWMRMDRATGEISPSLDSSRATDYGWDAIRTTWRIGVDLQWNDEPRARLVLRRMSFLSRALRQDGKLYAAYGHDGVIKARYESAAAYGCSLAYFLAADPSQAERIWRTKLVSLYDPSRHAWKVPLGYYPDNWVWFGLALHEHRLKDFIQILPPGGELP
jgi:endoglucanase